MHNNVIHISILLGIKSLAFFSKGVLHYFFVEKNQVGPRLLTAAFHASDKENGTYYLHPSLLLATAQVSLCLEEVFHDTCATKISWYIPELR
jgi:hypothetical protein